MRASISFQELQKLIAQKSKQTVNFEFVDNKTIKVLYEVNLGIFKKKVGVDVKMLDLVGTDLRMKFSAGFGMDGIIGMALNMVKDKIPAGLLEEQPDNVLLLHLAKVEKFKPVLERIDLKDVNMLTEAVELVGDFK